MSDNTPGKRRPRKPAPSGGKAVEKRMLKSSAVAGSSKPPGPSTSVQRQANSRKLNKPKKEQFKWYVPNFVTDLPHSGSSTRDCYLGFINKKFILAQFRGFGKDQYTKLLALKADEVADIYLSDGKPKVVDTALFGILGGLAGGRVCIIIETKDGHFISMESGLRTDGNRKRAAGIVGEMKACMKKKDPETKECPFCAETIKAKAIKCRYCGSMLDVSD